MREISTPVPERRFADEAPYIIGADPGLTGGVAVLTKTGGLAEAGRMPIIQIGNRKIVDGKELHDLFFGYRPARAIVELVNSMPKQGVASTFTFGRAAGGLESVLLAAGYPLEFVAPGKWKKFWGLDKSKQASLDKAKSLWPDHAVLWNVKANNGIAEAALIAEWYRRAVLCPVSS